MKQSKNIFERIKLYRINYNRNKKINVKNKNNIQESSKFVIKKQSKIKNFFKFLIGFVMGFFEYLVIKSNKKNIKKDNKLKKDELLNESSKQVINVKSNEKNQNNMIKKEIKENIEFKVENINQINNKSENNIDILNKVNLNTNNQKNNLVQVKNDLIVVEEQIIYSDTYEELEKAKTKIMVTKKELQLQKNNNTDILNELRKDKKNIDISKINLSFSSPSSKELYNGDISGKLEKNCLIKNNEIISEQIPIVKEKIDDNNLEIDELIKRCDEDLIIVEEKKAYIDLQNNYDEYLNNIENDNKEFNFSKKDLKQIKNNVNAILERQKYNFEQLNMYMQRPDNSKKILSKISNFFKNTAKLSFSIVPFFVFPNKLVGLTTSAVLFNNSIKSYRMKPNINYINQNIKFMISNNENCLKVGIQACNDSLNEINNIKYYLNNLSVEVKKSIEYRKYLVDVNATENLVNKQIQCLQKISKNYDNIKVKVKMREH